jgi:3-oxoacyl-[acyl-carrier-protein] synthase II
MSNIRVVITGVGTLSPLGNDVETMWNAMIHGKSGIGPITQFDTKDHVTKFAGEVRDFEATKYFKNPKDTRRTDRFVHLGMAAAKMALEDSGIDLEKTDLTQFGVIVGSGIGGLNTLEEQHTVLMEKGPRRVTPFIIPMLISNMASGMISMEWGLQGPNFAIVTACATSNHCVGEAWRLIREGEAKIFLAGGSESTITPLGVGGFNSMRALSTRNDEPPV